MYIKIHTRRTEGAIALSYPPRVSVRATVKLSAAFFHDESSITIGEGGGGGWGGVRKCNSALKSALDNDDKQHSKQKRP